MFFGNRQKKKEYTPQQAAFLDALRDPDNKGNFKVCAEIAGYAKGTPIAYIVRALKDEIIEVAKDHLVKAAIPAALRMSDIIDNPIEPGSNVAIMAAERIFDRVGITKVERVEIDNAPNNIMLLPARRKPSEDE